MTHDELLDKVARTICCPPHLAECDGKCSMHYFVPTARNVIAVVLEEVAKVCDGIEDTLTTQWKAGFKVCDYTQGASDGANDCAAAIRALIKKEPNT